MAHKHTHLWSATIARYINLSFYASVTETLERASSGTYVRCSLDIQIAIIPHDEKLRLKNIIIIIMHTLPYS